MNRSLLSDSETAVVGERSYLTWPCFEQSEVKVAVTDRVGGASSGHYESLNLGLHVTDDPDSVAQNRSIVAKDLDMAVDALVFCEQVHGSKVALVEKDSPQNLVFERGIAGVDAMVTTTVGVPLVILVADCVPVVILDPFARVLGVCHAGWRSTAGEVVPAMLKVMVAQGGEPGRMISALGPSIAQDCYSVGPEVAEAIAKVTGGGKGVVEEVRTQLFVDLSWANASMLLKAGLAPDSVHLPRYSTGPTSGTRFFSHRYAQPTGRFGLIAQLKS